MVFPNFKVAIFYVVNATALVQCARKILCSEIHLDKNHKIMTVQ